jgi:protein-tyrosine-phosphatase
MSLGTLELGDVEALPEAVALAHEHGVDLTEHRASGIREIDLAAADLIVGFERKHIAAVVVDARAPVERTFTLPELVGLLELAPATAGGDPALGARSAVQRAHASRPRDFRRAPIAELPDPLGLEHPAQRAVALEVRRLTARLAAALF